MTRLFQATWLLPIILAYAGFCLADLDVTYEWKYIDYVWQSAHQKQAAIQAGKYDYTKIFTNDVQPLSDGRLLITTPRYSDNPASLSTISKKTGKGGPLLEPYPNWTWHTKTDCSGITSVNSVFLDDYDRLWLVDSGKIGNNQVCSAKLLVFDANTDKLLKEVEIPSELSHSPTDPSKGRLDISTVETYGNTFDNTWAYIADIEGYGFLIWNGSAIWRLNDEIYSPQPGQTVFNIAGDEVTLALGPTTSVIMKSGWLKQPTLLTKPLAFNGPFAATLDDLHNSYAKKPTYYVGFFQEPSQETARTFTKKDQLFIGGFAQSMVACWNSNNTLAIENIGILSTDVTTLQYISAIKTILDPETNTETVWVSSNTLQKFIKNTVDFNEPNFRLMSTDVPTYVAGTVCEPGKLVEVDSIIQKGFAPVTSS